MFKRLASRCCFIILLCCSLAAAATEQHILVYGDSLSAGFGIAVSQSWPALLEQRLQANGSNLTVTNASISGETTAGGRTRLAAALAQFKPAIVILALGANDGLRGLPVTEMKANLAFMVVLAKRHGARVLLVGMHLPPNYGPKYTQEFDAAFRDIAQREKIALLPFLLEPIVFDQNAFQADGLHPTAAAQLKILDHVWSALKPLLT
jgi:acyl-CoA thioesterase-1